MPRFQAHGAELNQVWTNLLDNAIDAVGESGTIAVTTRLDGSCVEVEIADDGPGIPDDVRDRIFDPFFTTKDVGFGHRARADTARASSPSASRHTHPGGVAPRADRLQGPVAAQLGDLTDTITHATCVLHGCSASEAGTDRGRGYPERDHPGPP